MAHFPRGYQKSDQVPTREHIQGISTGLHRGELHLGHVFSSTDIAKFLVDYINWIKIFFSCSEALITVKDK